jgi:hypothetical protein
MPMTNAVMQMEQASLDMQVVTAKQYPRVISSVRENVLTLATVDQETATACHYAKPINKKTGECVVGPSIRLAEIIVATYGNLRVRTYPVEEKKESILVRADCWDLESNSASSADVIKSIMYAARGGKPPQRYSRHMIDTTINAALSIAYRNAVFRIVPMSLFKDQTYQIKQVAAGKGKTLKEQVGGCFTSFQGLGFSEEEFLRVAKVRKIDDFDLDKIIQMRSIFTSIKEGLLTKEDVLKSTPSQSQQAFADAVKPEAKE